MSTRPSLSARSITCSPDTSLEVSAIVLFLTVVGAGLLVVDSMVVIEGNGVRKSGLPRTGLLGNRAILARFIVGFVENSFVVRCWSGNYQAAAGSQINC